jgi:alkanesulfonate monooxygenase SsuD/methylene tetrahydromethanopterin reductase-like flavin-dependent oxidoreductase (luciferase family)
MTDGLGRTRPEASRTASEEVVQVMLDTWARTDDRTLEFQTVYDRGRLEGEISPRAYRPARPLLARGTNDAATIEKCGQLGWPVMYGRGDVATAERFVKLYTGALESAGHDAALVEYCRQWMAVTKLIYVGETEEAAERDGMAMLEPYLNQVGFLRVPPVSRNVPLPFATERIYFGNSREDILRNIALVGSPDSVAANLAEFAAIGMNHIRCWFIFGAHCEMRKAKSSFELFVREVMPRLNPEPIYEPTPAVAAAAASRWPI